MSGHGNATFKGYDGELGRVEILEFEGFLGIDVYETKRAGEERSAVNISWEDARELARKILGWEARR